MAKASEVDLLTICRYALDDFIDLNEYWNGSNGSAVDACQHTCEITEKALDYVRAALKQIGEL